MSLPFSSDGCENEATSTCSAVSGGSTRTTGTVYPWKAGSLSESN